MNETIPTVNPVEREVMVPIRQRWSPRAFADRPVDTELLKTLFEAARWSASSFNEQPWRFIVAQKQRDPESHARMLSVANEWNQRWAKLAPVLVLTVAKTHFSHNGKPNRHAWYDVGAAVAYFSLEATRQGLFVHQMAGFDAERARQSLAIPEGFEAVSLLALGHLGDPTQLPEDLQESERRKRERRPLSDTVFEGEFGRPASWL